MILDFGLQLSQLGANDWLKLLSGPVAPRGTACDAHQEVWLESK